MRRPTVSSLGFSGGKCMRGFAACLLGVLSLGALATMGACSDATDGGSGRAAGMSASAGGAGKAGSGTAGGSNTAGSGGGATCGFLTEACNDCLTGKCGSQLGVCTDDTACSNALGGLTVCVCTPGKDPDTCVGDFVTEVGDVAEKLANCYTLNCEDVCQ